MNRDNGDRTTDSPPKEGDWRSEAFKLEEVPDPYRTQLVQSALRELDEGIRSSEGIVEVRIRAWEKSIDRRIAAAVEQTAEEVSARVFIKIQRELTKVHERLDAVEAATESALGRAERAVEQSGQYHAVTIVNDIPTPPPKSTQAPELEKGLRKVVGKRWAKILAIVLGIVFTAVNAWLASRQ